MTIQEALQNIQQYGASFKTVDHIKHAGLLAIVLPGETLDFNKKKLLPLLNLLKAVGNADLSMGRIYEGHINALYLIHLFATQEQKERWFNDAAEGNLFGVWNAQPDNGLQISCSNNMFTLNGNKTFCSGTGYVTRALVTGDINSDAVKGWQMCVVNTEKISESQVDTSTWKPLGMQASASYTINFDNYNDTIDNLFGNTGDYLKQPYFTSGAIRFAAVQLGGAEALFNETIQYLKNQNRINDSFHIARVAEMATQLEAGSNWLKQAAAYYDAWYDDDKYIKKLMIYSNMTRTAIEKLCTVVIDLSMKSAGARGLNYPHKIEHIVRDLYFYLRQPASDAAVADIGKFIFEQNISIQNIWNDTNGFI